MIKQAVFEDDLIAGMIVGLSNKKAPNLSLAAENLHGAMNILQQQGLHKAAEQIFSLLQKIALKHKADKHTKGLTPDKQVKNLQDHGTPFNLACDIEVPPMKLHLSEDDLNADFEGLLDMDLSDDLEVSDQEILGDFEDEKD